MTVLQKLIGSGRNIFSFTQDILDFALVVVSCLLVLIDHLINTAQNSCLLSTELRILKYKIKYLFKAIAIKVGRDVPQSWPPMTNTKMARDTHTDRLSSW